MIQGKTKVNLATPEQLYACTNGGLDIFKLYLGNVSRLMNRPWGKKETKPSWGVFQNPSNGYWYFKDQAKEDSGTAVQFVQRYFGLGYKSAIEKICHDFGLGGKEIKAAPIILDTGSSAVERVYSKISFTSRVFKKAHHEFWNIVEVDEAYCKKMDCYAVKDLAINGKRVNIKVDETVFAYYSSEEDKVKIYFPEREKGKKFKSNLDFHYLWNFSSLKECEDLVVQKSNKDMIVTSLLFPCCTATMAEATKIFDDETVERINKKSKRPWIWYGSDPDGVEKCEVITHANRWKYINTPRNLLPEVNDVYGYVKWHNLKNTGTGLKELENFMKLKKLI